MAVRTVSQVLISRKFITVTPDTTVAATAETMRANRVGAVLVMAGDELKGIFTERDALYRVIGEGRTPAETRIAEVMTGELVTVHPDDWIASALRLMRDIGFRHLPVVGEDGAVVGIVSTRDIIAAAEFAALAGHPEVD